MDQLFTLFVSILLLSCHSLNVVMSASSLSSPGMRKHEMQFRPQDWDLIADLKNSLRSFTLEKMNPLLYGLSMAAGLALGVSIADSPPVSSFINRFDNRISKNSNGLDQHTSGSDISSTTNYGKTMASGLPKQPVIQKNVAVSKDGQDHYHHVVHYHIPYPLSMGAFNTAKNLYPSTSWYISETPGSQGKPVVVSGYMGPTGRTQSDHQATFLDPFTTGSMSGEETRRNDVRIHSSDVHNYFKSVPKALRKKLIRNGNEGTIPETMITGRSLGLGSSPHEGAFHQNHNLGGVFIPVSTNLASSNFLPPTNSLATPSSRSGSLRGMDSTFQTNSLASSSSHSLTSFNHHSDGKGSSTQKLTEEEEEEEESKGDNQTESNHNFSTTPSSSLPMPTLLEKLY